MAKETKVEIFPPSISSSLRHLDYHWDEITPEEFAEKLADKLKACGAKAWMLDVYCSNDQVYRNLVVRWKGQFLVKSIALRFNPNEGSTITVSEE